jgi:hypothetical protein
MPRFALGFVCVLVAVAVAVQLALPSYLEGRVEKRLERDGGDVRVAIGAFPAFRLLAEHGDHFDVDGTGIGVDLAERRERPFERLDGFDEVRIGLRDFEAGPLAVSSFRLDRHDPGDPYDLDMRAEASPRDVARFLGSRAAGPLGALLGDLAGGAFPDREVPLELTAEFESRGGRPEVVRASGSVAGVPAGPLTRIVLGAVLRRL